jgi:hypothetical protein
LGLLPRFVTPVASLCHARKLERLFCAAIFTLYIRMLYKKSYTGYVLIAVLLLILLWLLLVSRQRSRQIDKTLRETTLKK